MPINFPSGATGLTYSYNGVTWTYNGYAWVASSSGGGGGIGKLDPLVHKAQLVLLVQPVKMVKQEVKVQLDLKE